MSAYIRLFSISLIAIISLSLSAIATPVSIQSEHYIDLRDHTGQTFLQTMLDEDNGIVYHFDDDYDDEYEFADWEAVSYALENFDDKNRNRVLRSFGRSRSKMRSFSERLRSEVKTFTPETVNDKIGGMLQKMKIRGADKYSLGQFFAIASGAGTLIRINEDNYYYNIGYYAPEVRSGRSYGATNTHNANDASHLMYLGELEKFLSYDNNYEQFYKAIMAVLLRTDMSVYEDPTFGKYGEALLTDYITVYTAELRRHIMRNLRPSSAPWSNDMTEATFLSFFNVKSGLMMIEGELQEASIKQHWALSKSGSGRSGFGINRRDRRKLQAKISKFFRKHDDEEMRDVVLDIDNLIGKRRDGDVYRAVMEYLNNKANIGNPFRVKSVEDEIGPAFINFLNEVNENIDEILEEIQ